MSVAVEQDLPRLRAGSCMIALPVGTSRTRRLADEAERLPQASRRGYVGNAWDPSSPVRPTGNSTTRFSTRSSVSSRRDGEMCGPGTGIKPQRRVGGVNERREATRKI